MTDRMSSRERRTSIRVVALPSGTRTLTLFEDGVDRDPNDAPGRSPELSQSLQPGDDDKLLPPRVDAVVKLDVYDAAGRLVTRLVEGVKAGTKAGTTTTWRRSLTRGDPR